MSQADVLALEHTTPHHARCPLTRRVAPPVGATDATPALQSAWLLASRFKPRQIARMESAGLIQSEQLNSPVTSRPAAAGRTLVLEKSPDCAQEGLWNRPIGIGLQNTPEFRVGNMRPFKEVAEHPEQTVLAEQSIRIIDTPTGRNTPPRLWRDRSCARPFSHLFGSCR